MALAYDSDGTLDPAAAKAAGADFLGGYLDGNLTAAVAQAAEEEDVWLFSFWEGQAGNPNGGAPQGVADANDACNDADRAGQPLSVAASLPNDEEVTDEAAMLAYFQAGAQTIRSRKRIPGFYGQESVWQQVKGFGYEFYVHADDGTDGPWPEANVIQSRNADSTPAAQRQVGGMWCDTDWVQSPGCGFWNASGPYVETKPTPPTPEQEDIMLILNIAGKPNRVLTSAGTYFNLENEESKAWLIKYMGAKLGPGCGPATVEAPPEIPAALLAAFEAAK
jgi:hypothetical protein